MANTNGSVAGTVAVIGLAAAAAFVTMNSTHDWARGRIAANTRARLVARLNSVLDPALRGRDLTTTRVDASDAALLGSAEPVDAFVIAEGGTPVATVFATVAPNGYNASISLLVGVSPGGVVTGARVVRHRETTGLGDAIDAGKSDWIRQFDGKTLAAPQPPLWAVRREDGEFDSITGATVTSRAVITAVKNTLAYFAQHRDALYSRAADTISRPGDELDD